MIRFALLALLLCPAANAGAWGPEGHSVIAEIAQRRLTPQAAAMVERLLGPGHSLASVASWADDIRDVRRYTYNWHFVDIPLASTSYDASRDCRRTRKGDCVVAELDRLRGQLRCAGSEDLKRDALLYAVHFVGDIHQPLHTVGDARGGNQIEVEVALTPLRCTKRCKREAFRKNFHAVWDETLITSTVWDWGAYVERLEDGWLKSPQAASADGGTPRDWALETHAEARTVWNLLPASRVIDDDYYKKALPIVDRQLGLAGLRLARFLNEAYASSACPRQD